MGCRPAELRAPQLLVEVWSFLIGKPITRARAGVPIKGLVPDEKAWPVGRGLGFRVRGFENPLVEVQFDSEIPGLAPAKIEFEPAAPVINKGKENNSAPGNGEVPAAVWISNFGRMTSVTHRFLVCDTDDVRTEVRERVAQPPPDVPE